LTKICATLNRGINDIIEIISDLPEKEGADDGGAE
jgi:DNA-binding Xre family transcriptional regulator